MGVWRRKAVGPALFHIRATAHGVRIVEFQAHRHDRIRGPPLLTGTSTGAVLFVSVMQVWARAHSGVAPLLEAVAPNWLVLVEGGAIQCFAPANDTGGRCAARGFASDARVTDLVGGALAPGLITFGSNLGWSEIKLEPSTTDGRVFDPLTTAVPSTLGDTVVHAVDGLQTLYAYRGGVTTAVVARTGSGFLQAIRTTTAPNALANGAILQSTTALHISVHSEMDASVSTQIAALRHMLFSSSVAGPRSRVKAGEMPLVIKVHNADILATLLLLKAEFEASTSAYDVRGRDGGAPPRCPDRRRGRQCDPRARASVSAGTTASFFPALSATVTTLLQHGVTLALGVQSEYAARTVIYARFELAWAALNADGALDDQHGHGGRRLGGFSRRWVLRSGEQGTGCRFWPDPF
ncbi:hypothetical protein FB451DRAFT_1533305 [Mycena latifolia]|nr:hypothetical protein FB451DRAFT_1533305 [Mycena latifolia]